MGAALSPVARVLVSAHATCATKEVVHFMRAGVVGPLFPNDRAGRTPAPKHYNTMTKHPKTSKTPAPTSHVEAKQHIVAIETIAICERGTSKRYSPTPCDEGNSRLMGWVVSGLESY